MPTTVAVTGDDTVSAPLAIGFPFEFYGQTYTEIQVAVSGFLTVGNGNSNGGCCAGGVIPDVATPNGVIALYWVDLNQSAGGTIAYELQGTAPDRELVVSWNAVPHYSGGGHDGGGRDRVRDLRHPPAQSTGYWVTSDRTC